MDSLKINYSFCSEPQMFIVKNALSSTESKKNVRSSYLFGFNGKEQDDEISGDGNVYDYGFRIYNPRLGKFLSVDPLTNTYPMITPYQYACNSPIQCVDLDGLEGVKEVDNLAKTTTIIVDFYYVAETKQNRKIKGSNSGFTHKEVVQIKKGIMREFNKRKFTDDSNIDPITGIGYEVKLQINLVSFENMVDRNAAVNLVNNNPCSSVMALDRIKSTVIDNVDGTQGIVRGESLRGLLRIVNQWDSHTNTHELFHNLIHNNLNVSEKIKATIDYSNQEKFHKEAGGIFVYENEKTGTHLQNLNKKNIDEAIETVPER